MEYIVLDLEWNSAFCKSIGRFINEIIQIGAVKLNDNFDIVDTFQINVKSSIVKKLNKRVTELTGISNEQMCAGVPFKDAVLKYNAWADSAAVTMTWSVSDLYAIVENSRIFLDDNVKFHLTGYVDLQSYIQNELRILGNDITNQISLSNAADMLNISTTGFDLHTAKDDSYLCALMLKKCYDAKRFGDCLQNTSEGSFYDKLLFKPYYISNINDKRINKANLKFFCTQCKNRLKRESKWRFKNNWNRADYTCENCNVKFRCMLSAKQTFDKVITKKRILLLASDYEDKNVNMQKLPQKL